MEVKLNIANILKDKPSGTKLYADAFGELKLERVKVDKVDTIYTRTKEGMFYSFYNDGKYNKNGEPILVPSKEMRDWNKFAWKKGDVLVSNDYGTEVIFYDWYDNTYTNFHCKHYLNSEDKNKILYYKESLCATARYSLEDKDAAQTYINTIEERLGGKLNRKTLEIEKQTEFKDGDILYAEKDELHTDAIFILETAKGKGRYYACLILHPYMVCNCRCIGFISNKTLRYATEEEKQQLFDALAKKGKVWDAERKAIVDFKPKWITPKPFDRVITRNAYDDIWTANIFSHMNSCGEYVTIGCASGYPYCLPYNEETAKLIGTSNDWEE